MTELEKDPDHLLLHDELEDFTDLFIVKKDMISAKLDANMATLKAKVDNSKAYKKEAGNEFDAF